MPWLKIAGRKDGSIFGLGFKSKAALHATTEFIANNKHIMEIRAKRRKIPDISQKMAFNAAQFRWVCRDPNGNSGYISVQFSAKTKPDEEKSSERFCLPAITKEQVNIETTTGVILGWSEAQQHIFSSTACSEGSGVSCLFIMRGWAAFSKKMAFMRVGGRKMTR